MILKREKCLDLIFPVNNDKFNGSINFPNIRTIGYLFHLKNTLWRWARGNKLENKNIIGITSELIDKLVTLCWYPEKFKEAIKDLKSDNKGDFQDFFNLLRR